MHLTSATAVFLSLLGQFCLSSAPLCAVSPVVEHELMHCPVSVRLRHIHVGENLTPIPLSLCLNQSWRSPILVGPTCLHSVQLSSHSRIKSIIQFSQVSCKHTDLWVSVVFFRKKVRCSAFGQFVCVPGRTAADSFHTSFFLNGEDTNTSAGSHVITRS